MLTDKGLEFLKKERAEHEARLLEEELDREMDEILAEQFSHREDKKTCDVDMENVEASIDKIFKKWRRGRLVKAR
jgi:hypothetical protein